jgi:inosine-uridine nucleoside N-ribohydrolase
MATKVIIDTDPGVDDAMAVLFACLHPEIELIGLTSIFGNVTTNIATRNARVLLELAGSDVPVAGGAQKPIVQASKEVAWEVHGHDGFGTLPPIEPKTLPHRLSAAEFICAEVNKHPGEVVLCPVGPLTNIALALELDPTITEKVKSVTVMGGSLAEGGNVTSYAEANIWQDPEAADKVFAAYWDVTMVGLDVTHQVKCTPDEFTGLAEASPKLGGFLNKISQFYFDFHIEANGFRGCYMHDPAAVISIIRPEFFGTEPKALTVVTDGERVGETVVANDNRPDIAVCLKVDEEAVRSLFLETIKSGS